MPVQNENVIRTRIYTTNIQEWQKIAKAHHHFFSDIKPAATLIEAKSLIHPQNFGGN